MSLNIQKEPGIVQPAPESCPLNEHTPLTGPALWSAEGDARNAAFNEGGLNTHAHNDYWAQEPAPQAGTLPTLGSTTTGTDTGAQLPGAETVGMKFDSQPPIGDPLIR